MLLDYNKKYNASDYKKTYKTDEEFIANMDDIIKYNPLKLIDYVHTTLLKPICYFEKLDSKAHDKMNVLLNMLFDVSLYLRINNKDMQKYYNEGHM